MRELITFVSESNELLFGLVLGSAIEATQDPNAKLVEVDKKLYVVHCDNRSESIFGYVMQ
jgi:hypothetical protein